MSFTLHSMRYSSGSPQRTLNGTSLANGAKLATVWTCAELPTRFMGARQWQIQKFWNGRGRNTMLSSPIVFYWHSTENYRPTGTRFMPEKVINLRKFWCQQGRLTLESATGARHILVQGNFVCCHTVKMTPVRCVQLVQQVRATVWKKCRTKKISRPFASPIS